MTLDEFKRMIEGDFGPADAGMLGELVATVENMVEGGSDLSSAIYNAAQETRDTLSNIQNLRKDDLDDDLTDEFDAALDDEDSDDDVCDNCYAAGVSISQTCPECGRTLCAGCAAEDDGLCGACAAERDETDAEEAEDTDDDVPPTSE